MGVIAHRYGIGQFLAFDSKAQALRALAEAYRGFFVSFGYTQDAEPECAASHKRTGRIIKLLTVQEILDEKHVLKR
jgi:hypothetical protein